MRMIIAAIIPYKTIFPALKSFFSQKINYLLSVWNNIFMDLPVIQVHLYSIRDQSQGFSWFDRNYVPVLYYRICDISCYAAGFKNKAILQEE